MNLCTTAIALLLVGCGSSEPATTTAAPAKEAGAPAAEHGTDEHHRLTPELQAFHDQLAPRWHAAKGEERRKDSCAAMPEFKTRAAAVQSAAAPATVDAAAWQKAGADLVDTVSKLETACGSSDAAAFDAAFEVVHTSFHHAMELMMGEHEMMGEHGDEHEGRGEHEGGAGRGRNQDGH